MDVSIFASTEFCKNKILNGKPKELPWNDLKPGLSFAVPTNIVEESSFRSIVSSASKRDDRNYKCVKSEDKKWFEVTVLDNIVENALTFTIGEISPYMKAVIEENPIVMSKVLQEIPDGKCVTFPIKSLKEESLRTACSLWSRKLNKKFVCHKHIEYGIYEIANLTTALHKQNVSFFDPSEKILSKIDKTKEDS